MTLQAYLDAAKLSRTDFAGAVGCSAETIRRYIAGTRMPTPKMMEKIIHQTKGAVQPNDFFLQGAA